jgi:hypothetical protein
MEEREVEYNPRTYFHLINLHVSYGDKLRASKLYSTARTEITTPTQSFLTGVFILFAQYDRHVEASWVYADYKDASLTPPNFVRVQLMQLLREAVTAQEIDDPNAASNTLAAAINPFYASLEEFSPRAALLIMEAEETANMNERDMTQRKSDGEPRLVTDGTVE